MCCPIVLSTVTTSSVSTMQADYPDRDVIYLQKKFLNLTLKTEFKRENLMNFGEMGKKRFFNKDCLKNILKLNTYRQRRRFQIGI